jgi:hypothetical protein
MVNKMVKVTTLVLDTWEQKVQDGGGSTQLEINNDMRTITSHVISLVQIIVEIVTNPFFFLPGFRLFFSFFSFHEDAIFHIVTCVHV